MTQHTALYDLHLQSHGKMVDFADFSLPINYGSQLDEHKAVRLDAGMFDVSHMVVCDLSGAGAKDFLRYLLANDVAKLTKVGKALYSCMLNFRGGVIDDLIVYWLGDDNYRIISNATTREQDLAWMRQVIVEFDAVLDEQPACAMLAIQGPNARAKTLSAIPCELKADELARFYGIKHNGWFIGRTGYTGEDGFEVVSSHENIQKLWGDLLAISVRPCGLGARDSLRLEAGMSLYGNDLDATHTPLESGLKRSVSMADERKFIGKDKLTVPKLKMVGLTLSGKGIIRAGQEVLANDKVVGVVTSGGYAPSLDQSIGLARINVEVIGECEVQIRSRLINAKISGVVFLKKV